MPPTFHPNPSHFTPVSDQGQCGLCWSFVPLQVLSDIVKRHTGHSTFFDTYTYATQSPGVDPSVGPCSGAFVPEIYLDHPWVVTSHYEETPFKAEILPNLIERQRLNPIPEESKVYFTTFAFDSVNSMQQYLKEVGPCAFNIVGFKDIDEPYDPNTVWRPQRSTTQEDAVLNHIVELIGWDTDSWICRNSWGTKWPTIHDRPAYMMDGCFRIPLSYIDDETVLREVYGFLPHYRKGRVKARRNIFTPQNIVARSLNGRSTLNLALLTLVLLLFTSSFLSENRNPIEHR